MPVSYWKAWGCAMLLRGCRPRSHVCLNFVGCHHLGHTKLQQTAISMMSVLGHILCWLLCWEFHSE